MLIWEVQVCLAYDPCMLEHTGCCGLTGDIGGKKCHYGFSNAGNLVDQDRKELEKRERSDFALVMPITVSNGRLWGMQ